MSAENKRSMGWMIVMILLGIMALVGGIKWLTILIPAALLIWYNAGPLFGSGRN